VYTPPNVVFTPLALFTAPRDNAPDMGMDPTNDDIKLHAPSASISCVASTVLPSAESKLQQRVRDRRERYGKHAPMTNRRKPRAVFSNDGGHARAGISTLV